jgi:hypothetical protein
VIALENCFATQNGSLAVLDDRMNIQDPLFRDECHGGAANGVVVEKGGVSAVWRMHSDSRIATSSDCVFDECSARDCDRDTDAVRVWL